MPSRHTPAEKPGRLSRATWRRVEALLPQALALPGGQREDFLRERCAADPALYDELASLLRAADAAEDFLASPVQATIRGPGRAGRRLRIRCWGAVCARLLASEWRAEPEGDTDEPDGGRMEAG